MGVYLAVAGDGRVVILLRGANVELGRMSLRPDLNSSGWQRKACKLMCVRRSHTEAVTLLDALYSHDGQAACDFKQVPDFDAEHANTDHNPRYSPTTDLR